MLQSRTYLTANLIDINKKSGKPEDMIFNSSNFDQRLPVKRNYGKSNKLLKDKISTP